MSAIAERLRGDVRWRPNHLFCHQGHWGRRGGSRWLRLYYEVRAWRFHSDAVQWQVRLGYAGWQVRFEGNGTSDHPRTIRRRTA